MLTYVKRLEMKQLKDGITDLHASCTAIMSVVTKAGKSIKDWEWHGLFKGSEELWIFAHPVSVPRLEPLFKGKFTLDFKGMGTEGATDDNEDAEQF